MFAYLEQSRAMARGTPIQDPRSREAIAARLKALRMGLGFTQDHMARRLDSSTRGQLWANYEQADRLPRYDTLAQIAQKFGFSVLWILEGREDQLNAEQARTIQLGELRMAEEASRKAGRKRRKKSLSD